MSYRLLRAVRYTSLIGICLLAGYYASTNLFGPPRDPVSLAVENTTAASSASGGELQTVPDIRLKDLNGNWHDIAEWSGQPLLINFWATWCAPCLREMPMLDALAQSRPEGSLTVVGIAIDRLEDVTQYLDRTGVTYPILIGQSDAMEAAQAFGDDFAGLPFTVFATGDGDIIGVHSGELHPDQLATVVAIGDAVAARTLSVDEARRRLAQ